MEPYVTVTLRELLRKELELEEERFVACRDAIRYNPMYAHLDLRELRKLINSNRTFALKAASLGLTSKQLSPIFDCPYRTVQGYLSGIYTPFQVSNSGICNVMMLDTGLMKASDFYPFYNLYSKRKN